MSGIASVSANPGQYLSKRRTFTARSDDWRRYLDLDIWDIFEIVAIANQEARVATMFIVLASLSKTLLMGTAVFAFATVESFLYAAMIQGIIQTFILLNYLRTRFEGF